MTSPGNESSHSKAQLPPIVQLGSGLAPEVPKTLADTGLEPTTLYELALKLTSTVPHLTTDYASQHLRLPYQLIESIFWQLKEDRLVDVLGQSGMFGYRYAATQRGRDQAKALLEICGYVGPAPVSLEAYTAMLDWQISQRAKPSLEQVRDVIAPMVLSDEAVEVAALSALSGRSLFLFGPPGNGKTSLGRLLHEALAGELWIPHCIGVGSSVIRIYDKHMHGALDEIPSEMGHIDRRWVKVKPPLVVAGGEMTIAELDLAFSPSHRFYEAPPHVKANGGTFLIDDFGRQRVAPHELLNRWIIPLERQVDYLTLSTGQKIEIPFRLMLIIATNLNVNDVADPAFLRRMGYRLHLGKPSPQTYAEVFHRYAQNVNLQVPPGLVQQLLQRYAEEHRELRASEPHDLIERARDICLLRKQPFKIDAELMNVAWTAYFGQAVNSKA